MSSHAATLSTLVNGIIIFKLGARHRNHAFNVMTWFKPCASQSERCQIRNLKCDIWWTWNTQHMIRRRCVAIDVVAHTDWIRSNDENQTCNLSKEVGKQSSELRMKLIQKGGVWLYITQQWEVWDYIWRVVCYFTSHHNEKCEAILNEGWCVTLHHITMRHVRLDSIKGGVWLCITSQWEVWGYTQWRVVCNFTSHHNEKCEAILNEGWCVTLHHITMRSVRLHSMHGWCVWLHNTSQWEVWDYIQWRVVCGCTSHHTEKCETTFNEGWCVTLHHITLRSVRLHSMKGGVWLYITSYWEVWDYIQWRVVCDFTSHHTEKCETTFNEGWCVTVHHITLRSVRLYSMKGGVWLYITSHWEVWDYIQWRVVCDFTTHHTEKCETILNEGWCVTLHWNLNLQNAL